MRNRDETADVALDYLAPELLSGSISTDTDTTASKWWAFGSFLFEMLTGLPPFYNKSTEQRRHNILSEALESPQYLPAPAQDLLSKLLFCKPEDRLGSNGASEIKAHPFFDGIDWEKAARREYEPVFKPHQWETSFSQEKIPPPLSWEEVLEQFSGWSWGTPPNIEKRLNVAEVLENPSEQIDDWEIIEKKPNAAETPEIASEKKEDWELVWELEDQRFYFYNHSTKAKKTIISDRKKSLVLSNREQSQSLQSKSCPPDATQCQEAFEAVLENQYLHLIPALLEEYCLNLDINARLEFTRTTPINYVTSLENVETVRLFLENGADVNLEHGRLMGGRPLLTAVEKGNQELTKIFVQMTDRIPCTRALAHAVHQKDTSIVNILLDSGVKCDFKDSDRPAVSRPGDFETEWTTAEIEDPSEPDEYIPPLIRAILLPDVHLVQLLLAHGADVNIGYHDLSPYFNTWSEYPLGTVWNLHMHCGRPIQLAVELGHEGIVHLLLDHGADIDLPQPFWQHHHCGMIPRAAHHEITAQLRSAASGSV